MDDLGAFMQPEERVALADRALAAYYGGERSEIEHDPEAAAADLVTDLHHFADARGVDFERVLERSRTYYEGERAD